MKDLTERLRSTQNPGLAVRQQAAAEIESLRSRLAAANALLRGIRHNFYMAQQWADRIDAHLARQP